LFAISLTIITNIDKVFNNKLHTSMEYRLILLCFIILNMMFYFETIINSLSYSLDFRLTNLVSSSFTIDFIYFQLIQNIYRLSCEKSTFPVRS